MIFLATYYRIAPNRQNPQNPFPPKHGDGSGCKLLLCKADERGPLGLYGRKDLVTMLSEDHYSIIPTSGKQLTFLLVLQF